MNCSGLVHYAGASGGGGALVYAGKSAACAAPQSAIAAVDDKAIFPKFFTATLFLHALSRAPTPISAAVSQSRPVEANENSVRFP